METKENMFDEKNVELVPFEGEEIVERNRNIFDEDTIVLNEVIDKIKEISVGGSLNE